ncbi:polygalacturonase [Hephaestia caeni]|uniref:Polygalacturonase n=1 Tax=Hephaestia caeni TaxID=645617 RepID=A0A397PET8_9SPHN|nr:glycoside hydrolase family 28 protein [Hephaestia caeni]RIA46943.1 polygalacturonase [Hephaestia caeni]
MAHISRRQALLQGGAAFALSACASQTSGLSAGRPSTGSDPWARVDGLVASIGTTRFPEADFPAADHGLAAGRDARPAILAAIAACHEAGGGRVLVPAGTWRIDGPINLRSNVNLHLAEGAILRFSPDPERYLPQVFTRWEGTELYNLSPLFYTADAENVAITGKGTIDGQGEKHWLPWRDDQVEAQNRLRKMGNELVPVKDRVFGIKDRLRPHFVQFINCKRVLVEGITLVDAPFWVLHPLYCEDVTVRGITVISRHVNSDGIDPESSNRILIEGCRFDVDDDGVALKAGRDNDAWRVARPCTNVVIRNCTYVGRQGGAVSIGSEMSGGVSSVFAENLHIPHARHGLYFKANLDRGGEIRDIHIRGVRAGEIDAMITFTNAYKGYRGGDHPPRFETISIEDVRCESSRIGIFIKGDPRAPVRHILLRDIAIGRAEIALAATDYEDVIIDNVTVAGAPVTLANARDTTIGGIKD